MKYLLLFCAFVSISSAQSLDEVIYWKFEGEPGIDIVGGVVSKWPARLGSVPTQAQIDSWRSDYLAAKAIKDAEKAVDASNDKMSRWCERLTVLLIQKGVILKSDIPREVLETINERRVIRGEAPIP